MSSTPFPPPTRGEKLSWCFFDFANSSFTTVIVTAFFGTYFAKHIAADPDAGERLWSRAIWVSQLIVVLTSPVLGALADIGARKKRYLLRSWLVCVGATGALSWAGRGDVAFAWTMFVIANCAFSIGENVVAAFLPELATPAEIGRLSGLGWSIGYFGGLASLLIVVRMPNDATRWIPISVAGFFLAAGLPTMLRLKERAVPAATSTKAVVRTAFGSTLATVSEHARYPDLFRLLVSLFLQQAGIATVIAFAGIYAATQYSMSKDAVAWLFIWLQILAAGGAFAFGHLQDRIGAKAGLVTSVVIWLVAVGIVAAAPDVTTFQIGAAFAGLAMGSSQSSGRAMVALFAPSGRSGEWFGLWGLSTKLAGVVGPAIYDLLRGVMDARPAMLFNAVYFTIGLVVLTAVNERRGRRTATGT